MEFTYQTKGVCSHTIRFEVVDGVVHNVEIVGGCNGNSQGVAALVEGMPAEENVSNTQNSGYAI